MTLCVELLDFAPRTARFHACVPNCLPFSRAMQQDAAKFGPISLCLIV